MLKTGYSHRQHDFRNDLKPLQYLRRTAKACMSASTMLQNKTRRIRNEDTIITGSDRSGSQVFSEMAPIKIVKMRRYRFTEAFTDPCSVAYQSLIGSSLRHEIRWSRSSTTLEC